MNVQRVSPILNVSSLEDSFAWFEKLGWRKDWQWGHDPAEFGAVVNGGGEIFLCRDGQGARGEPAPPNLWQGESGAAWMSWWLETPAEVDAAHQRAVEAGCTISWPPTDMPWNVREFHVVHPDGHTFRVGASLPETAGNRE